MMKLTGVVVIGLTLLSAVAALPHQKDLAEDYRLPTHLVPVHYDLEITTKIEQFDERNKSSFNFDGTVNITMKAIKDGVGKIVLNVNNLVIKTVQLVKQGNDSLITIENSVTKPEIHRYELKLKNGTDNLINGTLIKDQLYILTISYTGYNEDDMYGFYRSFYEDENKKKRWVLITQLESVDARKVFPCFDEPAFKATFKVTMKVSKKAVNYHALANGGLEEETEIGDYRVYKFKKTVPMSSYLVAFVVSDFGATDATTFYSYYASDQGVKEYKTWARKKYINAKQGSISQYCGPSILEFLTIRLGVGYALDKIDQVGIPDFSAGAMENWGLLTYKERLLMVDENTTTTYSKQRVVTVLSHELSHQWFGNLVTLHWWSDIWLNEGFANYFEYFAAAQIATPNLDTTGWDLKSQFVINELQAAAFQTDAVDGTRALSSPALKPEEIQANFDNVAYSKGGSVLRMFSHVLGEGTFYNGLHLYLQQNHENVGTPEQLRNSLKQAADSASKKPNLPRSINVFDLWFSQPGYPVVIVKKSGGNFQLSQKRFLIKSESVLRADLRWYLPISYTTAKNPNFEETAPTNWLQPTKNLTLPFDGDWYILNIQQTGYYRVNYDTNNWEKLIRLLLDETDYKIIHPINRAQLIDDSWNLARSTDDKYLTYDYPLNLTKYLVHETDYIPWESALRQFSFYKDKVSSNVTMYEYFKNYVLELLEGRYNNLTFNSIDNEKHTDKLNRAQIISWACTLEHADCLTTAEELFDSDVSTNPPEGFHLNPDVKSTVYCAAIRSNNKNWDTLWKKYVRSTDSAEQTMILSALGCSKDNDTLKMYMNKTIIPNGGIRRQDNKDAFSSVYNGNPQSVPIALDFLENKLVSMAAMYGGVNPIGDILEEIAGKLSTAEDLNRMKAIQDQITSSTDPLVLIAKGNAEAAVNIIKSNIDWLKMKQPELEKWFKENNANSLTFSFITLFIIVFVKLF